MEFDLEKAIKGSVEQAVREYELTVGMSMKCALEKQIPKKPMYLDTRFRHHGRYISDGCSLSKCYKCPGCGGHIFRVFDSDIYCQRCGQSLDWSDEK